MSIAGLDEAIGETAGMLAERRSADGLWRDFRTLAGPSCDWVTSFVAFAADRCEQLRDMASDAIRRLYYRQRPNGGWGYNETVPTDCDSTSWALLAISTTSRWRPSATLRATEYVRRHWRDAQCGFSTYAPEDRIETYIDAPPELTGGWLSVHPCVTAVAIEALLSYGIRGPKLHGAATALQERQSSDGLWTSYWWPGFTYATYHSLRALIMAEALTGDVAERAREAIMARQDADGGWCDNEVQGSHAFSTSMALLTLLLQPDEKARHSIRRGIEFLIASRDPVDGTWPAVPILRIPAPMVSEPDPAEPWPADMPGTNTIVTDDRGIFSAAAALWALSVSRDVAVG